MKIQSKLDAKVPTFQHHELKAYAFKSALEVVTSSYRNNRHIYMTVAFISPSSMGYTLVIGYTLPRPSRVFL